MCTDRKSQQTLLGKTPRRGRGNGCCGNSVFSQQHFRTTLSHSAWWSGDFLADRAAVTSPVAVDFRGLVARQSPHVIDGQAGRPVGLERQRGEPVQGHEGEEAGVVDGVLVPGNQGGEGEKKSEREV